MDSIVRGAELLHKGPWAPAVLCSIASTIYLSIRQELTLVGGFPFAAKIGLEHYREDACPRAGGLSSSAGVQADCGLVEIGYRLHSVL